MACVNVNSCLPRSLDVQITLSRASTETRTDLSIMVVALENLGFLPDAGRVRFYSTIEAIENDFGPGTEAYFAASSFFAQSPRPPTMALGEVFLDPIPAENVSASLTETDIIAIEAVTDGKMDITYVPGTGSPPVPVSLTNLNFAGNTTIAEIAAVINAGLAAVDIACTVRTLPGRSEHLSIKTTTVGSGVTIAYPVDPGGVGTFVGAMLNLTEEKGGRIIKGCTSTGLADELTSIFNAANIVGRYLYGWTLGKSLRTTDHQKDAAAWALPRTAMMVLTSNDPLALDPASQLDIGFILKATDNRRATVVYHDKPQRYPDVSILAYILHVDYRLEDSTVTAKFKQLPGIETVQLTETEWSTLENKGYNTYTCIGNDARTYREGSTSGLPGWWMDTVVNLDNFLEDLSVNVYNVFLRNKKIPYTREGQLLIVDACQDTGVQYVYNGTFAPREKVDTNVKSGFVVIPAVQVLPTPINRASAADRVSRIGPPIQMIVQEAGVIHSTSINVELVQ